jgi:hypothetical protein
MSDQPAISIVHYCPGRVRLRVSSPPRDVERFIAAIKGHEGLHSVQFTPVTGSVLVRFSPDALVMQEVVMRTAMALSLEYDDAPVVVFEEPESGTISDVAAYAGFLTGAAALAQLLRGGAGNPALNKVAAGSVGAAVSQHGYREVRETGSFDPEVATLAYLAAAVARGEYLRGAIITWFMVFGRHLLARGAQGVEVRPVKRREGDDEPHQYEVVLAPAASQKAPVFQVLQTLASFITSAGASGDTGMLQELRQVSQAHGEMVEGLGWMRSDIPMRFK